MTKLKIMISYQISSSIAKKKLSLNLVNFQNVNCVLHSDRKDKIQFMNFVELAIQISPQQHYTVNARYFTP